MKLEEEKLHGQLKGKMQAKKYFCCVMDHWAASVFRLEENIVSEQNVNR
jgi:hypothetical protein